MKKISISILLAVGPLVAVFFAGCGGDEPSADAKVFEVKGVVHEVRDGGKMLVIDHEEMPGYMQAMIMPFHVAEGARAAAAELERADEVEFTYVVEELSSYISRIAATGRKVEIKPAEETPGAAEGAQPLLETGDELPDYEFVDENGKEVALSQYRGKPVALTFVFTRCPVPEFCPASMRKFASVNEALNGDADAPEEWQLLTISFDSWHDTPEIMKAYGKAFGQDKDPEHWKMLTTDTCCTITAIAGNVGLKFGEVNGSYQHNIRTVVLDAEGKITRVFTDETWEVEELVEEIKKVRRG